MNNATLAIFGAGGFAREVLQIALDINALTPTWQVAGFLVDPAHHPPPTLHGLPVLGGIEWLALRPDVQLVIAVGSSVARRRIALAIEAAGHRRFASLVHPRAWVGRNVDIAEGSVVCAGALITTDIRIRRHVHVNIGATIGHDADLHDFVTLNPSVNVSGNVTLHEGVEVGTGSVLVPHAHVGPWSIVGAGTVVTKPQPANATIVGAPGRAIKTREAGWHEGAAT